MFLGQEWKRSGKRTSHNEEVNVQFYLARHSENEGPVAFVLDPEYPVFRQPCPEKSPDPVYCVQPFIEPPMLGWKLHPHTMPFGLPSNKKSNVWKMAQAAGGLLSPHFEEIGTSSAKKEEKMKIECLNKHPE
jgi:hypothetical protein